ncbi:unnamed protein product [Calypogeia fissa]
MALVLNHGSPHSFSNCNVCIRKNIIRTCESARKSLCNSFDELPLDRIGAVTCRWGTSVGLFCAGRGMNLNRNARMGKGFRWNENVNANGKLRLKLPGSQIGGAFLRVREIRGLGFKQDAKTSLDRRREQQRKRGRRKPGLKADDVGLSTGYWRLFGVEVPLEKDLGKDEFSISDSVLDAIATALKCSGVNLPKSSFSVVRKSLDARKDPRFVYTIDLDVENLVQNGAKAQNVLSLLQPIPGKAEFSPSQRSPVDLVARLQHLKGDEVGGHLEANSSSPECVGRDVVSESQELPRTSSGSVGWTSSAKKGRVVVVGSGPAGLFAALSLAETGVEVVLLERGQPVESRGRDIGALMVRRILDPNSNLCYGEGGAGTWSDGKLTTRIGKNGSSVQTVLATLVRFGAPKQILVDGKPHLGTDRLVRILQNLRSHLLGLGVNIMFGTKLDDLEVEAGRVIGVRVSSVSGSQNNFGGDLLKADAVVLAVGHSARDVFDRLLHHNVSMTAKPFAVGFRIEHPQELINEMQYHRWANEVQRGKGKLPVADYKLATDVSSPSNEGSLDAKEHGGRGCFSFCMCPGGQVVPTSTSSSELCINGMSFSNRSSKWANAAIVVSVSEPDFSTLVSNSGPLTGVAFQRVIEQEAAVRGGGNFVVPAQTVTDFLDNKLTGDILPSSSYRLGVKAAYLHDLLPSHLTESLKEALFSFEKQLPGFIDKRGLLHGVETRTSSPVRVERHKETFESTSLAGLYPIGEGAGHAGGIVSAAVDGMLVGLQLAKKFSPSNSILQNCFL